MCGRGQRARVHIVLELLSRPSLLADRLYIDAWPVSGYVL